MFRTSDLARVAVSEFRRGLEGLTAEEAATRLPKADGTIMNAIAWSVEHIAQHWSNARWAATGAPGSVPPAPSDGTPPSWQDALAYLDSAASDLSWIEETSDEQFAAITSGLSSLTMGASRCFDADGVDQVIVEMGSAYMFVTTVSMGSCLGVIADKECDMGLIAYEMTLLVDRFGDLLTPELIAELKNLVAV